MIRTAVLAVAFLAAVLGMTTARADIYGQDLYPNYLDPDDVAWFYNRTDATPAAVVADTQDCTRFGAILMQRYRGGDGPTYPGGILTSLMSQGYAAGPIVSYADDCMIAKGYRRFNIEGVKLREFEQRFQSMSPELQMEYVRAEQPPEGVLRRQWANVYWLATDNEQQTFPLPSRRIAPHAIYGSRYAAMLISQDNQFGSIWDVKSLNPVREGATLATRGDGAVLLFTMRATVGSSRPCVTFQRSRYDSGDPDPVTDRNDARILFVTSKCSRGNDATSPKSHVFVVPAGTYSLFSATLQRHDVRFCLGTVAFEAKAGDIIDLGDYTVAPGSEIISATSPPPKIRISIDQPAIDQQRRAMLGADGLATQLKPARYINGFPGICYPGAGYIAGFDIPGAQSWNAQTLQPDMSVAITP